MARREHASAGPVPQDLPAAARDPVWTAELHARLLGWYHGARRDLPWRRTRDPYAIWVSEVMLQQTRVETVIPYYARFLERFPTPEALAEAPEDDVLAAWSGLGYYRRARLLQRGAASVVARGEGLPSTREALREVPGIGPYTSGAIASIAYGEAVGLVDGNVARVLARLLALGDDMRGPGMRRAQSVADHLVHRGDPGAWNQALMELGATVCTPRAPACLTCPVAASCAARAQGRQSELPVLSPKPPPRALRVQAVVATKGAAVLLARRAGDGLFGGLWEPPCRDGGEDARDALLAGLALRGELTSAGTVVHVLSHRRLAVDVTHVTLARAPRAAPARPAWEAYDAARLVAPADMDRLGISTLARKVLDAARRKAGR
jgi:A/G-specific adenine glycosylase